MTIEAVTFDWWHTVAETPWPDYDEHMREIRVRAIRDHLARHGVRIDDAILYRAYDEQAALLARTWARDVDLSPEEQVKAFLSFATLDDAVGLEDGIQRAMGEAMFRNMPALNPHIADTLTRLKSEGYRIGMVSNTGRTWGRFLREVQERLGIARYFDVRVFSDEARVRKPGKEIFDRALAALGLGPAVVVHVGDDVTADIAGARRAGMRAVWYNTGFWPGAKTNEANAEIHDFAELPSILAEWRER